MNVATKWIATLFVCYAAIMAFNFLGTLTPQSRIDKVIRDADKANQLDQTSNVLNDMFTECATLDVQLVRDKNPIHDISGTLFSMPAGHPCDGIKAHLGGLNDQGTPIIKYHYGARYLFAVLSAFLSLENIRSLMAILSIVAPLTLGAAFLFSAPDQFLAISPLVLVLLAGFNSSNLARNIAHAPGFIFPLLALSGVIVFRKYFTRVENRFVAYIAIAALATYFDIMNGPLPFILATTVVVNHFCFNADKKGPEWFRESVAIGMTFILTFAAIVGLRLAIATIVFGINPLPDFENTLAIRFSTSVSTLPITRYETLSLLWKTNGNAFFGSGITAKSFYLAGAIAWIVAFAIVVTRRTAWREVSVLFGASAIIAVWYLVFVNHTFVHYAFMGRIGAFIPAAGLMALVLTVKRWLSAAVMAALPILWIPALAGGTFMKVTVGPLMPMQSTKIDVATCSNDLAIAPDGLPDKVISVTLNGPEYGTSSLKVVVLIRWNPVGVYTTHAASFPVAVLTQEGKLLSAPDRSVSAPLKKQTTLLLAICDDKTDRSDTTYHVNIVTSIRGF